MRGCGVSPFAPRAEARRAQACAGQREQRGRRSISGPPRHVFTFSAQVRGEAVVRRFGAFLCAWRIERTSAHHIIDEDECAVT